MVTYGMSGLGSMYVDFTGTPELYTFSANSYLIGFEDRILDNYGGAYLTAGDDDYNDILMLVDLGAAGSGITAAMGPMGAAAAVPEPATLTLVVAGLAGICLYGRRNRRS